MVITKMQRISFLKQATDRHVLIYSMHRNDILLYTIHSNFIRRDIFLLVKLCEIYFITSIYLRNNNPNENNSFK